MKQTNTNRYWAFLALLMGLAFLPNTAKAQTVEDGTAEHPFLIESEQELWDFHDCMVPGNDFYFVKATGTYTMTRPSSGREGTDFFKILTGCKNTYIKLTTDIVINRGNVAGCDGVKDPSWKAWTPMEVFTGHFDGDYHIVSGLYCTERDESATNHRNERGFFTQASDTSTIKNLGITNSYIAGAKSVGGICGWLLEGSSIDGCFFEGTLEATDVNAGGIVGICESDASVSNCYSTGQVFSTSRHVGGIVGENSGGSTITNCYTNMMLQSEGSQTAAVCGFDNVGGPVTNCYYDKQLSTLNTNDLATGVLTNTMISGSWNILGNRFSYENGLYPYITGFSLDKPSVAMSVMPFILNAISDVQYDDVSNLNADFTLGSRPGATWAVESWNDCLTADHATVSVHKEGIADLRVQMDTLTRTFVLFPHKVPLLGSEENPFIIENLDHLTTFRDGINFGSDFVFRRINVDYSNLENIHWKQVNDIDMSSVPNWTPVGIANLPFEGHYNGDGHEIKNLTYTSGGYRALFSYSRGHIKNLGIRDASITSCSGSAGLIAVMKGGSVDNCYNTGDNASFIFNGRGGGLICDISNGGNSLTDSVVVSNSHNDCDLILKVVTDIGGVIGYVYSKYAFITHCYNTGKITTMVNRTSKSDWTGIGGIIGHSEGNSSGNNVNISFCYNKGDISTEWGFVAGIVGDGRSCNVSYCFNSGNIIDRFPGSTNWCNVSGIMSYSGSPSYCFNTGTIITYGSGTVSSSGASGISTNSCYNCVNVGDVYDYELINNSQTCIIGSGSYNIARGVGIFMKPGSYYDKDMYPESTSANGYSTSELVGQNSVLKTKLGTQYWLYEEGMYPRLKWTDTCDWARDIAIAAATPILFLSEDQNVDKVKPGMKLFGCDSNVVWKEIPPEEGEPGGCLFVNLEEDYQNMTCTNNAITPRLNEICLGPTTIGAYVNDILVKTVTLRRYVEPTKDTLTIDNLEDLQNLQAGVNSGEAFYYKDYLLPRFADSIHFRVTADIDMPDDNWEAIGGVDFNSRFGGFVMGEGHTISNLQCNGTYSGLFGICTGAIMDLHLTNVNISGGDYRGAVCAKLLNGKVLNCTAEGTITGGAVAYNNEFYTGGLVGWSAGKDTIQNCVNNVTLNVTGSYSRSGGIVGYGNGNTRVINCHNEAAITSNYRVGGIIGEGGTAQYCYNLGEVTGESQCEYAGGICGVGNPSYCYNAGIVYGNNKNYVGGIVGSGNPSYCYNSNTVRSTGIQLGGVAGTGTPSHCYYDKQLCPEGGVNRADVTDGAEGMATEAMLTEGLKGKLGNNANWSFQNMLYPQLDALKNTDPSVSSVMPVSLDNDQTWKTVSNNFFMHGCQSDQSKWTLLQGNCVTVDNSQCKTTTNGVGIVQLGAIVNDKTYRVVRLLVNINESNPLIIKNLTELKNFRNVINSPLGYYNFMDSTYHTALTAEDSTHLDNFLEIKDGGLDLYFKQVVDIYMSGESGSWQPVADYATNEEWAFKGNYNGDGHKISGLKLTENKNYRGLFGYISMGGVVRNLTIEAAQMSNNSQHKGILCGMNYNGRIENCAVTHSKITGGSTYTGVLCGTNYADIQHCTLTSDTLQSTGERAGGICGYNEYGVIDSCYSEQLYMTGGGSYKGGICGYNMRGKIYHSEIRNSVMDAASAYMGGISGYNTNYYNSVNDTKYPAYIQYCNNRNTVVKSSNSYVGGIVGRNYYRYSYVQDCFVTGGSVESTNNSHVGGICGAQNYYTTDNKIIRCVNENPVKGNSYVGGITGYMDQASIDSCENRASVTGATYVGGILGYAQNNSYLTHTVNRGNVTGSADHVGGIQGYMSNNNSSRVIHSYNMGRVQGTNSVGGIVGKILHGAVQNSYNVGIVKGVSQIGGLIGSQEQTVTVNSTNSYNAGWVEGTSMVGSICGYTPVYKFDKCAYDLQMCPIGGIYGADIAATKPLLTTELAGSTATLQGILGTNEWVYTDGMYPRLTKIDTGKAAVASALPVWLGATPTDTICANDVPEGHYTLTGCDTVSWIRHQGYGLSITGCDLNATGRNYVQIANVMGGDTLKVVQLMLGISEENPLEITDETQLKKFRDLVNSNQTFYYDDNMKIFYESEGAGYVEIPPGGEGMYFKLTKDMDLTLESDNWVPIGNYASSTNLMFKGHFNGDGHSITGLTIKNSSANYQGLFGYVRGTVKNVRMVKCNITGTKSNYGSIAGYNYGTIENCSSVGGTLKGSNYVGGIAGSNKYDQIFICYNNSYVTGTQYVGGIAGSSTDAGVISQCFNAGVVTATSTESYVGGICGYAATEVNNCYNAGVINGNNRMGGIVGWSQNQWISYCYNVGLVHSSSTNPTNVGAVAASDNGSYYPNHCYYDWQMSCQDGGVGNGILQNNSTDRTTLKYTVDMVGDKLSNEVIANGLSPEYWIFTDSLYPRLKALENCDGSVVSVQPVFISDWLKCNQLELPFIAKSNDSIQWARYGTGHALNIDNIADGKLGISICGPDTLVVKKSDDIKIVPVEVLRMAATTVVDTACDGFYVWAANGRVYTESCDVTIALTVSEGCDSVMHLKLTIPPAIEITMDSKNYNCNESTDAYAQATVTGGFDQGYLYFWTNESGDTISKTNRIDASTCGVNFGPGTYHLSVRDQIHPDCEKGTDVTITQPTELVLTPGVFDGQCYNQNDGYIEFSVAGGSMPYKVDWGTTDTITVSRAATDTIAGLAAGTYTVQVTDAHGCTKTSGSITLEEDATEYIISAFGVNKMYDGIAVNPNQYILKIGENEPDTIASGSFKVLDNGDTLRATVSCTETSVKNVISQANNITAFSISKNGVDQTCRYNVTTQNSNVIITKRDVILTSASAQKVYDGQPLTNHTVTISGSGFAAGEDTLSCTVTGSRTNAGASDNTFTYELKDNTLETNYDITEVPGRLVVGPAELVLVVANSATKMYDGTPLTDSGYSYIFPTGTGVGDTIYVAVRGTITKAGNVENRIDSASIRVVEKATGTDVTGNFRFAPVVHGTLTVTKRNVTLSTVSDSKVYDGTPLARPEVTLSGDGFVEGEVTSYAANNSITNVGTDTNVITVTTGAGYLAENYNLQKSEGTLTVTKRPLNIIGESRSIDYDGRAHNLTSFTAPNLVAGHTISGLTYTASGTQTGTYDGQFNGTPVVTDAVGVNVTDNYEINTQQGTLSIGQTILPLVVKSNSNHFTYDGQPHTYQNYTVLYNGESLSPTNGTTGYTLPTGDVLTITPNLTGSEGITHVSQNAEKNNAFAINLENVDNYSVITLDTGKIEIDPRMVILRSKNDYKIYDGTALPSSVANSNLSVERSGLGFVPGESVVCTVTGSQTKVGSSSNTFEYTAGNNTDLQDYDITRNYGTLTVAPATLTIAANDKTRAYGEDNPTFDYSISGFVHNESLENGAPFEGEARPVLSTTATRESPAGIYPITVDLADVRFENYVVTPQNGNLTIGKRNVTIRTLSVPELTYDGLEHDWHESQAPGYEVVGGNLLENDSVTSVYISGSRTIAGTTSIELNNVKVEHFEINGEDTVRNDVTSSYNITPENGSITIIPRKITIKPLPFDTVFTGTTYTSANSPAPHYEVVEGSLQGNDSIVSITISGSRASFGKTPFVIAPNSIKIVDTTEVHDYSDLTPQQLRNSGYEISVLTDTLNVKHRDNPYPITISGKKDTVEYNGEAQTKSGWIVNVFEFNGYTYYVDQLTSSATATTVGTYNSQIQGDTVVKNAAGENVTAEFSVTAVPGSLTITQRPVTITAKGVDVMYDFLPHSSSAHYATPYTVEGLLSNHSISAITLTGQRTAVGREPIHIEPSSVHIEVTLTHNEVTENYSITCVDSAIHIRDRVPKDTLPIVSKSRTVIYDGTQHSLNGFDTLQFIIYANDAQRTPVHFHVNGVTAETGGKTAVGQYKNAITGSPTVLDENNQDVSGSFVVLADTGTLTINPRPITLTARDTNFYYDGAEHSAAQMSTPRYIINDSTQLLSGHNLVTDVTSRTINALDDTAHTKVGAVTITDAGGHEVTANYAVTKFNGLLKIEGFPGAIVITSASAELECNGQPQKKEEYTVTYDNEPLTAVYGSNGLKFAMPTATHDTLTITPTFAGITTPSQNADSNNVYSYSLLNDTKYVGTRTLVKGTIKMYDSLKVVVTPTPVTCNGLNDGKADVTITGGKKNAGNYSYKLDDGSATNTTGTVNLTNLANGSHTFYVSDSLNYDKTVNFTITQPDALTLMLTSDKPVCEDGSVMSFTTGGNGGNKFKLNDHADDNVGIYNHLSAGSYTVTVTDSKGCTATQSVTLDAITVTETVGITRGGEITTYAPDTTVDASGSLTAFPALTASGEIIAQPALSNCTAEVNGHKVTVSVNVASIGVLPILEFEVSTDENFRTTAPMYTHKVAQVTVGTQTFDFEDLPAGTYYVRAKLYNCAGGQIIETSATVTVVE